MSDDTRTSPATAIERATTQANTSDDAADGCFICQKQLWLSYFFDEPLHDAEVEKGTEIISKIGKLFYAHADEKKRGIYRLYYNGLGTAFKGDSAVSKRTAQATAKEEAEKAALDKLSGIGKGEDLASLNPKNWGTDLLGLIAKLAIEAGPARDAPIVSQFTLSGVKTRIDNALAKTAEIVKDQTIRITRIHVAVFGAGMGGALARLFINKLRGQCRKDGDTLYYPTAQGEAALELRFLGLLDCVSATMDDNPATSFVASKFSGGFATLRVDGPMGIARAVAETVHYVAGHEVRLTRRVDSVRKAEGSYSEVVLPGSHEDIVGGYANQVRGRSNQLARLALGKLHSKAYAAGVPIWSMEKLKAKSTKLYEDFQFSQKVPVKNSEYGARTLAWRYGETGGSLEEQLIAHMRRFVSWLRLRHDDLRHPKRPPQAVYDLVEKQINRLRLMVEHPHSTYRQYGDMRSFQGMIENPRDTDPYSREELILLKAWAEPLPLNDYAMALFDEFVHDEMYRSAFDLAAADASNNGYFKLRGIDQSDELEIKKYDAEAARRTAGGYRH